MLVTLTMRPAPGAAHVRRGGEHGVQRRPEVGAHRLVVVGERHLLGRPHLDDAGVVDEEPDLAELLAHDGHHVAHLRGVADVARHADHVALAAAARHGTRHELLARARQRLGVAGADGHAGAPRRRAGGRARGRARASRR
jgi:hypothetical protein